MGCGYEAACIDCKVRTPRLGYGSYSSWLSHTRTLAEYDAQPVLLRMIPKNIAWRAFLAQHEGHRLAVWSEDYAELRAGVLEYDDNILPPLDMRDFVVVPCG
jgi:hypothetical protein